MGDLEDVMMALRAADEAGNVEDATKFAGMADRLSQKEASPDRSRGTMPFLNKAIAGTLGAPVDLATAGINLIPGVDIQEPVGGSKSIGKGMEAMGVQLPDEGARPETPAEYIGTGVGEAVGFLLPFMKTAQTLSKGVGLTSKISKSILEGVKKYPLLSSTAEITGGGGAGAGRYVGEEVYPEKKWVRPLAEMGGGIVGGLLPTAAVHMPSAMTLRATKRLIAKGALPFGEKGSKYRAGQFIKKQVKDPGEAAAKAVEETIGGLPPAIATGEKRIMALYKQFRDADAVVDADAVEKIGKSIYKLEQELRVMGYGAPEMIQNVLKKRVTAIELKMQKRVADAMGVAQKKLDALPVAVRRSKEAIIVRNELEKVMKGEFDKTNVLWGNVDKSIKVDYAGSKQSYDNIVKNLSRAERKDVPEVLRSSFLAKKKVKYPINVKEMQGLRSKLLEEQRIARKDGKWNKARISGDVADSLLDDMDVGTDDALSIAIAGTRKFKERFEQGIVGKILGRDKSGAPAISPELTLDVSIGRAGLKGAVDINKVAVTPDAISATKRYIARSFTDYVTDKGTKNFNVAKAQKWVSSNQEILDKFPDIKSQLNDISGAQKYADDTLQLMTARKAQLQDPRISTASKFIKADLGKEIDGVFKSHNPVNETRKLIRLAGKDQTGDALEGLKGSYVDYIIEKSSIGAYNEVGEQTFSGKTLLNFMNQNRKVLREIFSQEQIVRMQKIGKELSKLETSEKVKGFGAIELDDMASNFLRTISRFGGAAVGRYLSKAVLGGATIQHPAYMSEIFKKYASYLSKDRAFQLIHESITVDDGGKLLNALLLPLDKPQTAEVLKNLAILNKRISLWLIGTGSRVMKDIDEEIRGESQPKDMQKLQELKGTSTLIP